MIISLPFADLPLPFRRPFTAFSNVLGHLLSPQARMAGLAAELEAARQEAAIAATEHATVTTQPLPCVSAAFAAKILPAFALWFHCLPTRVGRHGS